MKVAQVIVDMPLMQTDQPYSYSVDAMWDIEVGMRVTVPFGKKDTLKQGFVVDVTEVEGENQDLKPILSIEDTEPVLNHELLSLADYLAKESLAFKITCFQTMLPTALNKQYEVYYEWIGQEENRFIECFDTNGLVAQKQLTDKQRRQFLKLEKEGKVRRLYKDKKKGDIKKDFELRKIVNDEVIEEAYSASKKNATRWRSFLMSLSQLDDQWYNEQSLRSRYDWTLQTLRKAEAEGLIERREVEIYRSVMEVEHQPSFHQLNLEQQHAFNAIMEAFHNQREEVFLLQGVTGSGKTEVYLQAINEVLKEGKTALVLVPEIALTPQMVARFQKQFGREVAVMHSQLSNGERYDEWRRVKRKEAHIVVGARSAIFAPLEDLGIIIIDEEHETTYKQEEMPRYHARDVAIWRGKYHHCPVVLGSATPSLETKARARTGVYTELLMNKRANPNAMLPQVEIIDLSKGALIESQSSLSIPLIEAIKETLLRDEQVVLMLNRRGFSSFVMCRDCGHVLQCPNCDISLTLHMDNKKMRCHYCGHEEAIPYYCPVCHGNHIKYYGTGTEKVEEELKTLFPNENIIRMDVDTTRKKGMHKKLLKQFENKEARILLGTQMIAKGLDFPNVTLVGVINADTSLYLPDFRSSERTFQLLTQVSGRAGRGNKQGRVLIQTYNKDHYAIQLACQHDYERFFYQEMHMRHIGNYSPYFYTVSVTVKSEDEALAHRYANIIKQELCPYLSKEAIVLGPSQQPVARMKNQYYFQMVIKYKKEDKLLEKLKALVVDMQLNERRGLYISIDNEPLHFI